MDGVISISTILLVDIEVGGSPPCICCTNPTKENTPKLLYEVVIGLENPIVVN